MKRLILVALALGTAACGTGFRASNGVFVDAQGRQATDVSPDPLMACEWAIYGETAGRRLLFGLSPLAGMAAGGPRDTLEFKQCMEAKGYTWREVPLEDHPKAPDATP